MIYLPKYSGMELAMNEKHFHATRHLRFAPIDLETIPPNARYWQNSADGQLCRLQEIVGDEQARKMIMHIEGTWRQIYEAIGILADLAEKQKARPRHIVTRAWAEKHLNSLDNLPDGMEISI